MTNSSLVSYSLDILLVDDNPINLQLLGKALLSIFTVRRLDLAYDGYQALRLLEHRHYNVLLLDIDMPGIDGIETTQYIRRQPSSSIAHVLDANRSIPIVAVTTNDSVEARHLYQKVGIDACLGKPIIISQLKSQLLGLLDLSP
ncbi:CheY-like superfamily [Absidia repens]|uniref:CheY-like superfamily n=1 Tax=Absidia repens TaxID=90262 RepID=A0A1X2ICM7_9FUNG|nr:CheY-like superfamily [Absidia repens]